MPNLFAVWLVAALPSIASGARTPRVPAAAMDFSVAKPAAKKKGFVARVLEHADGGDFHGFGNSDGTSRKAENFLHTMTVRFKLAF